MVRAANEVGLKTKMFGGGMVGTQFAAFKTQLGPLLNNVVNYEFWAPEAAGKLPFVSRFLVKYQARAAKEKVDPLGYYLPPYSYAMMEVVEQAIEATKSLDQKKLAEYIHANEFATAVGVVRFAKNGEWAKGRVMSVQYGGIKSNDLSEFQKPGVNTILWPPEYKTGAVKAPFK
jgi:branched-chain amino acid transport system substrate-binding protein